METTSKRTDTGIAQRKWIQILHVAKRECSLDDQSYRSLLYGAAGVRSSSEIKTWEQYNSVLKAFARLGFKVKSGKSAKTGLKKTEPQKGRAATRVSARQEYYIRGLWDLASRQKDEASLRAMIKRIAGVEYFEWVSKENVTKVILALKDIAEKEGYNPARPPSVGSKER